jgi:hypothetical protein
VGCDKGNSVSDEPAVSIFRVEVLSMRMQIEFYFETLLLPSGAHLPEGTDIEIKVRGNLRFTAVEFAQFTDIETGRQLKSFAVFPDRSRFASLCWKVYSVGAFPTKWKGLLQFSVPTGTKF